MSFARRLLVALLVLAPVAASAQIYYQIGGKNKVRYDTFDWKIYETAHFQISYYDRVEPQLETIASFAESSYDELARRLNFQIFEPVQLIVYANHAEFEQTNVIVSFIPEGTGAFATPVRNRMVLPADLADKDLQQLIQHELTHIFQYEILYQGRRGRAIYRRPPTWFMEGMASYFADDEDGKAKAYMRDATLNDRLPSVAQPVGGYFAYRFGNKVFTFIEEEWGEDAVRDFVFSFRNSVGNSVARPLEKVFRMSVDEFDGAFRGWLRQHYADYRDRQTAREFGRPFLAEQNQISQEVSPVASPSGDLVAAFTTVKEDVDVALFGVPDRRLYRNLTAGHTTQYEYLIAQHLSVGGERGRDLAFSPDSDYVAVFARTERTRSLLLLDAKKGGIARRVDIPLPIDQAAQPAFSPDGRTVAFSAVTEGRSDIYLLELETERITNLTQDDPWDTAPAFSPSGNTLVYSSEAGERAKLMELRLDGSNARRQLTFGPGNDEAPVLSLDGERVYFTSDREQEVYDIYSYELATGRMLRLTHVAGAALNPMPVMTLEGERVVFQAFSRGAWNLHVADPNLAEEVEPASQEEFGLDLEPFLPAVSISVDTSKSKDLGRRKLFLENAFLNVGVDQDGNFLSQTYITLSDQYGDRRFSIILDSVDTFSDFRVSWINLEPRLQWGVTLYDDRSYYLTGYDPLREGFYDRQQTYRQSGLVLFGQYPLSKYMRAEGSVGYLDRTIDYLVPTEEYNEFDVISYKDQIPMVGVGLVGDTVAWKRYGPHAGSRWELGASYYHDLEDGGTLSRNFTFEGRSYLPISRRNEIAVRLFLGYAEGNRPNLYSFGGHDTVRGFSTYSISGNRAGFVNIEWRFPLIDYMQLPFLAVGDIRGRFFVDVGAGWYVRDGEEYNYLGQPGFQFIGEKEVNGEIVGESGRLQDGVAAYGFGFSMTLLGLPLHWDFVKRWDFKDTLGKTETHFWIGYRF